MAEAGVAIPSFTAYRTSAITMTNMNSTRGIDVGMQTLARYCVEAREVLEQYRSERSDEVIEIFWQAIYDAESLLTALPAVFDNIFNAQQALRKAQQEYINNVTDIQGVSANSQVERKGEIYDLMGRRLSRIPERGVYIIDGKVYAK